MAGKRVVVIEDEEPIRRGIVDCLSMAGYDPEEAADGEKGFQAAQTDDTELVLLDLQLPGADGLEILKHIRRRRPTLPVIILTARGSEDDRVRGLKLGADDYVVKPFSARELLARVEAVLRRSPDRPHPIHALSCQGQTVDLDRCEIRHADGNVTALSDMETEILKHLGHNAGRVISREELLARVWGIDHHRLETRAVDMHITRLRNKLVSQEGASADEWITTVRGKGYMLGRDLQIERRDGEGQS